MKYVCVLAAKPPFVAVLLDRLDSNKQWKCSSDELSRWTMARQVVDAETNGDALAKAAEHYRTTDFRHVSLQLLVVGAAHANDDRPAMLPSDRGARAPVSSLGLDAPTPRAVDVADVADVAGVDCVVYDVETKWCLPTTGEAPRASLRYCNASDDWLGMGISVVCAIDTRDMIPRVFLEDNFGAFCALIEGRCVAGHSNHTFDDPLVTAHGATITRSYDLIRHVRVAVGEPPHYVPRLTRGGRRVNDFARVNLNGLQKSEDGALAPVMYQEGRIGALIDYCVRDVTIEARLIAKLPSLIDPRTGRTVVLPVPH